MAVGFWYLENVTCPGYVICTVAYTSATFYKVPEHYCHVYLNGLYVPLYHVQLHCTMYSTYCTMYNVPIILLNLKHVKQIFNKFFFF